MTASNPHAPLAAAMPLLEAADSVTVAAVRLSADDTFDLEPVADWIKAHGAKAGTSIIDAGNEEISDVLIQHARRHDGALLGHGRIQSQPA